VHVSRFRSYAGRLNRASEEMSEGVASEGVASEGVASYDPDVSQLSPSYRARAGHPRVAGETHERFDMRI